ncbi:MAG: CPBP family intramembrane metalloprotease [Verrucomicrobia bacterium]|nr:CPBP family intramembrane metalloprotease [Verrucomicrobiota bacterium]
MKPLLPLICLSLFATATYANAELLMEPELFQQSQYQSGIDLELSRAAFTPRKSPAIAVGLSTLLPGLGHVYLGDFKTASGLIGTTSLYAGLCFLRPHSEALVLTNVNLISNTWFYGIYAAYRDVRAYNVCDVYSCAMPRETLGELALAPFQWSVMKKREVWLALLVDLSLAIGLQYFLGPKDSEFQVQHSRDKSSFPLVAFPVGIGEESFFRGFLQSYFSERFTPWGGIAVSSAAFGAAHIPNASGLKRSERRHYYSVILPFITLSGVYYGWVTYKNCSLKESVALHCWYDFAIFLASYSLTKSVTIGEPCFAFSIPF